MCHNIYKGLKYLLTKIMILLIKENKINKLIIIDNILKPINILIFSIITKSNQIIKYNNNNRVNKKIQNKTREILLKNYYRIIKTLI